MGPQGSCMNNIVILKDYRFLFLVTRNAYEKLKHLFNRAEINNGLNALRVCILDAIYRRDDCC